MLEAKNYQNYAKLWGFERSSVLKPTYLENYSIDFAHIRPKYLEYVQVQHTKIWTWYRKVTFWPKMGVHNYTYTYFAQI